MFIREITNKNNVIQMENYESKKLEMIEMLNQLKLLGRAYRKLHFKKHDSGKFYNIALDEKKSGLCDNEGNLEQLFLNIVNSSEQEIKESYSELFRLTGGKRNIKFYKKGTKALYVEDILDIYEEVGRIPYMGEICGRIYAESSKLFACDYNEDEFVRAKEEYQPMWVDALKELDRVLANIDIYIVYNKDIVCEIVDSENDFIDEKISV